jgi:predicted DNA-binding protein
MDTQTTTVRLPQELYERLRDEAYATRTKQAEIVRQALAERYERIDREAAAAAVA